MIIINDSNNNNNNQLKFTYMVGNSIKRPDSIVKKFNLS